MTRAGFPRHFTKKMLPAGFVAHCLSEPGLSEFSGQEGAGASGDVRRKWGAGSVVQWLRGHSGVCAGPEALRGLASQCQEGGSPG